MRRMRQEQTIQFFKSLEDFISAIEEAVFQNPKTHNNAGTWKAAFLRSYKRKQGLILLFRDGLR